MSDIGDAALEARARRAAARVGLIARKSRRRRGSIDNLGGFALFDPARNWIVAGQRFDLSAAEVIEYCSEPPPTDKGGTPDAVVPEEAGAREEVAAEYVPPRVSDRSRGAVYVVGAAIPAAKEDGPPSVPEPGPGSILRMTPGGFELDPRLPEQEERDDPDQKALHTRVIRRCEVVRELMVRISNTHPTLAAEFADYELFVSADLAALDVASLWSAGSALLEFIRAFDTQDPSSTITPQLEPETLAEFRALLRDHTAFILGFETGRKLTERVAALHEIERRPEEI
jgi:hypothetical protein